jgi:alpha-galactosidase
LRHCVFFLPRPHFNLSAASDPEGSFQIRSKGETLKTLMGDKVPILATTSSGATGAIDFASTVGVGGVVGTQFVLLNLVEKRSKSDLTPQRKKVLENWLQSYKVNMRSRSRHLGDLYDMGLDRPEAHRNRKGREIYYAVFGRHCRGPIELRSLQRRQ